MLIQNSIKCNNCGDILVSRHRHDFVRCKCGGCMTDGGLEYIHRGGDNYTSLDLYLSDDIEKIRNNFVRLDGYLKDMPNDKLEHILKAVLRLTVFSADREFDPLLLMYIKEKQYRNELFEEA